MKVPIDYIRGNFPKFSFVGVIALLFAFCLQPHLPHQLLNGLVVNINTIIM